MNPATDLVPAADDPRLLGAVQEYLHELEAGRRPDRRAFAARFPDLAEAMAPYLDALDVVHAAAPLLHQPSGGDPAPAAEPLTAEPLGDFRILREVGRGGMGVVYEAVQRSLGRKVALKVLPFASALDARQLQRFKNEAQAAAHLHHQNIVPVYAVGVERGVHFYAMQFIEGQNLAALIKDLRKRARISDSQLQIDKGSHSSGQVGNRQPAIGNPQADTGPGVAAELSTQRSGRPGEFYRSAARLAAQAAEALDYAHGMGVVHRDVKPANLLLDGRGAVWVTDFGLAQFHADGALTQTGDLLGTLRYMSPEQAGGQRLLTDHRTDVYSLGATLYELLTLRPIFDGTDRQTLLRQILHEEPRPPRALDRTIPPELETIVLKAVGKTPGERYGSARELADDLQRYLRHEPIRARRATAVQRARKWLKRHPSVLVAGAVLLVLLTAGSLLSAWLIQGEQEKTRLAFERERQRAAEAEARFQLARRSADELINVAQEVLADNPHLHGLRKRLLEAALVYYQEFIEQRRDDPDAQAALRETRDRVKKILSDLAVLQGAGQIFLLLNPAVLDDLRLSEEQRGRVAELKHRADQRWEAFQGFRRLTPEEQKERFLELARATEADIAAVLNKEQINRLRQIALQSQGTRAFLETEVAAKLQLTVGQRERIRAIEAELSFDRSNGHHHADAPPKPKSPEELRDAAMVRIRALLTEAQARRWRQMTGEPFRGPLPMACPEPKRP
jgi:serine/threonine protein kinase